MLDYSFSPQTYYLVKDGQTIGEVCKLFQISPYALIRVNSLDVWKTGIVLLIPTETKKEDEEEWQTFLSRNIEKEHTLY